MGGELGRVNKNLCYRLEKKYCPSEKPYGGTILLCGIPSSANCCCDARQPCVVSHSLRTFPPPSATLLSAIPRNGRHTYTTTFGTNNNNHGTTSSKRSLFFSVFVVVLLTTCAPRTQPTYSSINATYTHNAHSVSSDTTFHP